MNLWHYDHCMIELALITVFYFIILIFQIHITSSPMTCLILHCNFTQYLLFNDRFPPVERIFPQFENNVLFKINVFFYSLWNLDFVRYVSPPFCIRKSVKLIHTTLLGYMCQFCILSSWWLWLGSASSYFQPIVWLWRPFHGCLAKLRRGYGSQQSIIDVFSAFFLLSHSKLMFQTTFFLSCTEISNISDDSWWSMSQPPDVVALGIVIIQ